MKAAIVALLVWLLLATAIRASFAGEGEQAEPPVRMQMTPEQAQGCKDQGGCIVITKRALINLVRQACEPKTSV
jgi:hypothetical protein